MINLRRTAAVAVAAAALALGGLAVPASAATSNGAAGIPQAQTSASGMHATVHAATAPSGGAVRNQSLAPAFSACSVSAFGYGGEAICGTQVLVVASNGTPQEVFVIGTDWAVWHAWPGSNGWHTLHGVALHTTSNGVSLWSDNPYSIWIYGTDGKQWCDNWGSPAWGSWHLCNPNQ